MSASQPTMSRRALLAAAGGLGVAFAYCASGESSARSKLVLVALSTEKGVIEISVDSRRAPISAFDFLKYVDLQLLDGGAFYRAIHPQNDRNPVKIAGIQGGVTVDSKMLAPIAHEPTSTTGIFHRHGTVTLARAAAGTAIGGSFFVCIGPQPALDFGGLRNPDGLGFAAFGHVTRGMRIVQDIWSEPTNPPDDGIGGQIISSPIKIVSAKRM